MEPMMPTGIVQALVFGSLLGQAQTADELRQSTGRSRASVATAIHALKAKKLIVNSGCNRLTERGRSAVVWRAIDGPAPDVQDETLGIMPGLRWRCK